MIFAAMFVLAVLATAMYSWLGVHSKIFKPQRDKIQLKSEFFDDLFDCHWCLGTWIAIVVVPATHVGLCLFGLASWWTLLTLPLTVPAVAFVQARLLDSQ